jgi:hypothetical protein
VLLVLLTVFLVPPAQLVLVVTLDIMLMQLTDVLHVLPIVVNVPLVQLALLPNVMLVM